MAEIASYKELPEGAVVAEESGNPVFSEPDPDSRIYRVTAGELRGFIERIERLDVEKAELAEAVKAVKTEAKARGYDVKALTAILRRRKQDRDAVSEQDALIALYEDALGIFS